MLPHRELGQPLSGDGNPHVSKPRSRASVDGVMPATSHWAQMAAKNGVTSLLSRASLLGDLEADLERAGAVGRRLDRVFCEAAREVLRDSAFDIVLDADQRIWATPQPELPVIVVDIDRPSIEAFGPWPWPRETIARLVRVGE